MSTGGILRVVVFQIAANYNLYYLSGFSHAFLAPGAGWTKSTAQLSGFRDLVAFVKDDSDGATNVTMVATQVAGDYKKLTWFGLRLINWE